MSLGDLITLICLLVALWYAPRYLWRVYGPQIMSRLGGSHENDSGSETGSDEVVLPQQNQVKPELVFDFAAARSFFSSHNLSDDEAVELLAILRCNGDFLISANKIRDIVGGSDATVKSQVARYRPRQRTAPARRLERPANGW